MEMLVLAADLVAGDVLVRIDGSTGVVAEVKWLGLRKGHLVTFADGSTEALHSVKARIRKEAS